jgi:glycosyltransferase involved in cell wall biosynthesis
MKVSIVCPAFNEGKSIRMVAEKIKKAAGPGAEIMVIDDGSKDNTYDEARKVAGIRVLRHVVNRGKAAALRTGFRSATGDVIVTIDSDGTHPPRQIPELVRALESRGCDLVVGSRFRHGIQEENAIHRGIANMFGSFVTSIILWKRVTDVSCGMRAFRRSLIENIRITAKGLDFEAEFTSRTISGGFRYAEVPITVDKTYGRSNLKFLRDNVRFFVAVLRGRLA